MSQLKILFTLVFLLSLAQMSCKLPESKTEPTVQPAIQPPVRPTVQPAEKQHEEQPETVETADDLYTAYAVEAAVDAKAGELVVRGRENKASKDKMIVADTSQNEQESSLAASPSANIAVLGMKSKSGGMAKKEVRAQGSSLGGALSRHYGMAAQHTVVLNSESYDSISEGKIFEAITDPLSTFSIDVDTASYSNVRRLIEQGQKPPVDAVRIEEMINYFSYPYPNPTSEPFSVQLETSQAPWNTAKKLVRIGIKGKEIQADKRPASNLVFLIDVSGSMDSNEKLPLVKSAMTMLVDRLEKNDKVSIVVYAGAAGLVLEPTTGDNKNQIIKALDRLKAGGSTNGSGGIELAYQTASKNFIKGGVNRVVLATDGDFNVGTTSREGLLEIVKKHADQNIYLSVLGFGMGNYKDGMMETLSNKGNGNYAYVDNLNEARKVMVEQMTGTLITIAKDVKIQVEFNPKLVASYRLIGYENRILNHQDFNDDKKDAGDIGAGHTVTALYEITPVGSLDVESNSGIDALKYQAKEKTIQVEQKLDQASASGELLTLKLRYKRPDGNVSKKIEMALMNSNTNFKSASESFKFAAAVAMFGMHLRESKHMNNMDLSQVREIANSAKGEDRNGYKKEFIELVEKYEVLLRGQRSSTIGYSGE